MRLDEELYERDRGAYKANPGHNKATGASVLPLPFQFLTAWVGVCVAQHQADQLLSSRGGVSASMYFGTRRVVDVSGLRAAMEHGSVLAGGKHRRASAEARRQFEAGVSEKAMSQSPVAARLGDPSYTTTV